MTDIPQLPALPSILDFSNLGQHQLIYFILFINFFTWWGIPELHLRVVRPLVALPLVDYGGCNYLFIAIIRHKGT